MLIVIHGEDTYRSREWLRELQSKFKIKFDAHGYNLASFSGNCDVGELRAAVTAPPFLSAKRMVVVERLFEMQGTKDSLENVFSNIPESTIMIVWEAGDPESSKKISTFSKLLKRKGIKIYPFPLLSGAQIESWARKQAKNLGVSFERGALLELVARVGSDLWQLSGELEKFFALGKPVTREIVEELVRGNTPENIFGFTDALVAHDARRAMKELENERVNGAAVPYLISMLARQFRILCEACDYIRAHDGATSNELAKAFGWHPFVAKKTLAQVRKFDSKELSRAADVIFQAERDVKTGVFDADTALDLLVSKLLAAVV